ncbi:MAG: uncharacterized protein A8A55_2516 [Amphiamblys sp. WSBS2006]|nr:MAG: uncharacterized protein A8A55_2516 [Amphiamblys sp. WSBS2006]
MFHLLLLLKIALSKQLLGGKGFHRTTTSTFSVSKDSVEDFILFEQRIDRDFFIDTRELKAKTKVAAIGAETEHTIRVLDEHGDETTCDVERPAYETEEKTIRLQITIKVLRWNTQNITLTVEHPLHLRYQKAGSDSKSKYKTVFLAPSTLTPSVSFLSAPIKTETPIGHKEPAVYIVTYAVLFLGAVRIFLAVFKHN